MSIMLFGDRCARDFGQGYERALLHEIPELRVELDDLAGVVWLNSLLESYRARISPPRDLDL